MATIVKNLSVLIRESNGAVKQLSFVNDKKFLAQGPVQITIADGSSKAIPKDVILRKSGNNLLIQVKGEAESFEVVDFYSSKSSVYFDSTFSGSSLDVSTVAASSVDAAPIVWQSSATEVAGAATGGGFSWGGLLGGLGGLGVGALIGAGTGKAVAMVLGAIGGAVAGNEVQKHYDKPVAGQQIFVRTSGGVLVSVTQPASNLRVGQKVYIEGAGTDARVIGQ
jgi:outer membrane lipoprotein SlyB